MTYKHTKTNIEISRQLEGFCPFICFEPALSWQTPILLPWFQLAYVDLHQVRIKLNRQ